MKKVRIYGPSYFSNWADLFMPKIANSILPFVSKFDWITPNKITVFSFSLYALASALILWRIQYHLIIAALLLPISYIFDCLDGQLSRTKNLSSYLGSYLDRNLDFLKIFFLMAALSLYVYQNTGNVVYIFLGFIAGYFFGFRFYIKYVAMNIESAKDREYLDKAKAHTEAIYLKIEAQYKNLSKSFIGRIKLFWLQNRSIFFVDEAELIIFTSVACLFNALDIVLWIFAISQVLNSTYRLIQRGYQVQYAPNELLVSMRK